MLQPGVLQPGAEGSNPEIAEWSLSTLQRIFHGVAKQNDLSVRFCMFIDGLDEYDGDHIELCQTLKRLAESTDIKICLSSRPWTVFEDAFGFDINKIYMHHLTQDDILKYTRSRMNEHPRWSALMTEDPSQGNWLIEEVERRAAGVFLWVFLVTKRLRESLTNRDRVQDIRRRLESLPVELEIFFKQILDSVDPFYHDKMAITLQVAIETKEILPAIALDFLEQEYDDAEYVFKLPVRPFKASEEKQLKEQALWWLSSRTRGLLEMDEAIGEITFLHRTVRDFLQTREMVEYLATKIPARFSIPSSLLKIYVAMVKRRQFDDPVSSELGDISGTQGELLSRREPKLRKIRRREELHRAALDFGGGSLEVGSKQYTLQPLISAVISCAAEMEGSRMPELSFKMIDELDRVLVEKFSQKQWFYMESKQGYSPETYFRLQLLKASTGNTFLPTKLPLNPNYFASLGNLAVPIMMSPTRKLGKTNEAFDKVDLSVVGWELDEQRLPMLQLALDTQSLNLNVHESPHGLPGSPWQWLIEAMLIGGKKKISDDQFWTLVDGGIVSRLLRRGANADAVLENPRGRFEGVILYPVLLVYMVRAWVAPPTTTYHAQKYLQDVSEFFKKRNPLNRAFAPALFDYLDFLRRVRGNEFDLDRSLMVKSICRVFDLVVEDVRGSLLEFRTLLHDISVALKSFIPAEDHWVFANQYMKATHAKRAERNQAAAGLDLEREAPKAKEV